MLYLGMGIVWVLVNFFLVLVGYKHSIENVLVGYWFTIAFTTVIGSVYHLWLYQLYTIKHMESVSAYRGTGSEYEMRATYHKLQLSIMIRYFLLPNSFLVIVGLLVLWLAEV